VVWVTVVYMVAYVASDETEAFVELAEMRLAPARPVATHALEQLDGASREGCICTPGIVHDDQRPGLRPIAS